MWKALAAIVLCGLAGLLAANIRQAPARLEPVQFSQRFLEALQDIDSAKPATLSEKQLRDFRSKETIQ